MGRAKSISKPKSGNQFKKYQKATKEEHAHQECRWYPQNHNIRAIHDWRGSMKL